MKKPNKMQSVQALKQTIGNQVSQKKAEKRMILAVSAGTCGQARGSLKVIDALKAAVKEKNLEDAVQIKTTGCHGFCEAEPNIIVYPEGIFYQRVQPGSAEDIISKTVLDREIMDELLYIDPISEKPIQHERDIPFYKKQNRMVLGHNALIDPTDINDYFSINGYSALIKALSDFSPEKIIEEIQKSGLRGRGGAGFPTGLKWDSTRKAKGDKKYIICNADEGDPGAYMDRSLMEGNPHCIIEGMLIGACAIGAEEGYIYIRDEYPLAVKHISHAISQAEELGLLGDNILGTGLNFKLHISKGAGAFVCGEETSLIASIEGKVGEPKQRPPFPAEKGLWKKPTNINNVETWANIPLIINQGADKYSQTGTNGSKGTKIFSLVGKIINTGLVEVPMGIGLREIIYDVGGGIPNRKKFKAVQTGGPSGGCLPKDKLDLPIDYEGLTQAGSIMGSGGMIVMDENTCMVDVAKYFLNFLRDESCGKCLSCREGTQRMWEIVKRITEGRGNEDDLNLLESLAHAVKGASLCGLGQTAANPVLSTLRYFRDEYHAHIKQKKCPAGVCILLVSAPCHHACPIDTEASSYIALIAQRKFREALEVNYFHNPLPSVCSRVCHHPCETRCRAGNMESPIAVRNLKRFVTDYARKKGSLDYALPKPAKEKSEKVAVVGAGPAGLMAGWELRKSDYQVTIFESESVPGGMLAWGIPEYRLPKDVLYSEIDEIKKFGITIQTNTRIGKDLTIEDLFSQGYKAIFIATGAPLNLGLGIPGEDTEGIIDPIQFLKKYNLEKKAEIGKKVAVVGGGNTAIDAARTAWRLGSEVTILYRRTRNEMPAIPEEIDAAIEEGIKIEYLTLPVKAYSKNGKLTKIQCTRMALGEFDKSGRRKAIPIEGSEFEMEVDSLIPAIGQEPDLTFLSKDTQLKVSKWNTLEIDAETMATNVAGIFAGGDVVSGPATVLEAMQAGKIAAESIHKYLSGEDLARDYKLTEPRLEVPQVEIDVEEETERTRPWMQTLSVKERVNNFKEVELGYSEEDAVKEAQRCFRCDLEALRMKREKNETA